MASLSLRDQALRLMRIIGTSSCRCPAHSQTFSAGSRLSSTAKDRIEPECAFEVANSSIRYGEGVTREVGMDFKNHGLKKVCVITDQKLVNLPPVQAAIESLEKNGVNYELYDKVRIEPTDASFKDAIDFAKRGQFDSFLAVGGGSVIDTAKAANLYLCHPENDFLDFVNEPIGKGMPVNKVLKPLIAIPTTAGTGSETTGVAIFDYEPLKTKTGIANRAIRPLLGIVDPLHTLHMSERLTANSGYDVLCHAIESYTAIPYQMRGPRPPNPNLRPAYQGSNPVSDVWSKHALGIVAKYLKRSIKDSEDLEARSNMHLASVYAGVGFGNAGVHLCHGMSYPISGLVKSYKAKQYDVEHPLVMTTAQDVETSVTVNNNSPIQDCVHPDDQTQPTREVTLGFKPFTIGRSRPHGLSVVVTAPAVFRFTAPASPDRHLEAAKILGADTTNVKLADAGLLLSDTLRDFMHSTGVDNGLTDLGYKPEDISALVKGTLPQHRVTKLAPAGAPGEDELARLFEDSMTVY